MFKRIAAVVMAVIMTLTVAAVFTSCSGDASGLKIGVILVGDETEGYTKAHMDGIKEAASSLGIAESQIIWKYKVEETSACLDAATDLVGQGCSLVISNSYGHQTFMVQAAEQFPDVTFVSMTGDFAAICGVPNMKNGFTKIYEAGYVGAYNYAEVVSGYTAFFLGVQSIVPNVVMEVNYTNSWFDIDKEAATAEALVANGCVIIGQHADSTGAPSACEKLLGQGKVCYSVGYNVDMLETAPNAALTSPTNTWSEFYKDLFSLAKDGKASDFGTDVAKGFTENGVAITTLGPACAAGTAEKVAEVEAAIRDGSLHVFDTSKFTVSAEQTTCDVVTDDAGHLASCKVNMSFMDWSTMTAIYEGPTVECITDGYFTESTLRSAPYFSVRIDGIVEK